MRQGRVGAEPASLLLCCTSRMQAARVWAVDLSPVAVAHAKYNAQMAGVSQHVDVVQGSWFEPLEHLRGHLGGVLSNPPYIPQVQMAGLQAEVKQHEPWTALDGGPDLGLNSLEVKITQCWFQRVIGLHMWLRDLCAPPLLCAGHLSWRGGYAATRWLPGSRGRYALYHAPSFMLS